MIFSNREHEEDDSFLSIGQKSIKSVKDYKLLGVLVDDKLSFRFHVNKILSNVSKSAGLLYKIRNCLPPETHLSNYYYFIYPLLSCNIASWGKAHEFIFKLLITTPKRIIRTIDGAPYRGHTNPLFVKYPILSLNEIYTYAVCIQRFKARMANQLNPSHIINKI